MALVLLGSTARKQLWRLLPMVNARHGHNKINRHGKREVVGYGWNGDECYMDRLDYPFPPLRFREFDKEMNKIREKESDDWRKMSLEEKKKLYRHSFCQTLAEVKAPTGEWKYALAMGIWMSVIGYLMTLVLHIVGYPPLPESFQEESRQAQLKRMIALEVNPVTGLASKWDYETGDWKRPWWVRKEEEPPEKKEEVEEEPPAEPAGKKGK